MVSLMSRSMTEDKPPLTAKSKQVNGKSLRKSLRKEDFQSQAAKLHDYYILGQVNVGPPGAIFGSSLILHVK